MKKLIPLVAILITVTLAPAAASKPYYGSASIAVDAQLLSYDGIPAFMGTGTFTGKMGYEFTEHWGLYGLASMGLGVDVITFHDFLEFPAIPRFAAGIGAHWRSGRFTLGLEIDALLTMTAGSKMIGGEVRLLPKYNLLVPEDLCIAYAVSFPVTAEFSADGMAISVGIALSMEVGTHLE